MIEIDTVRLSVDHYSFNVLYGWALDTSTGHFPSNMSVRNPDGATYPVNTDDLQDRNDVRSALARHTHASPLGFRVNLLDAFNAVPTDYSIYVGDTPVWHFRDRLAELEATVPRQSGNFIETGHRNIVFVSPKGGTLRQGIGALRTWQSQVIEKKFLSGVSVSLVDHLGFEKNCSRLKRDGYQTILVLEGRELRRIWRYAPEIVEDARKICLRGGVMDFRDFWGGTLNVAAGVSPIAINGEAAVSPLHIYLMISSIYISAPMFFPIDEERYFIHQSGPVDEDVAQWSRTMLQAGLDSDVVLVSRRPVRRLAAMSESDSVVFVSVNAIGRTLDLMATSAGEFIHRALCRGLRVQQFVLQNVA